MPNTLLRATYFAVTLISSTLYVLSVHCVNDKHPTNTADSRSYLSGIRFEPKPSNSRSSFLDLFGTQVRSDLVKTPSPISVTPESILKKSLITLDSAPTEEIYKKAASEYWSNEVSNQDLSQEDQSEYGYGQHNQQSHNGYLTPQSSYEKGKEISITPNHKPITLHYRTHSQPIMVHQTRIPGTYIHIYI